MPFKLIPPKTKVRILSGPIKNSKIIYGSGLISQWLGIYEKEIIKKIIKELKPNKIYYDIGAHVGYYTILFSKFAKLVYSFEPEPTNFYFLKENLKLNRIKNVKILNIAIYSENREFNFDIKDDRTEGKIKDNGILKVCAFTIDYLCLMKNLYFPDLMKIDVEGAELEVLKGAIKILNLKKPKILISFHSEDLKKDTILFLSNIGYNVKKIKEDIFLFK
ncbi:MAG: FkbM family methyltransferase [Candidatus Hydrothermales bacterium]